MYTTISDPKCTVVPERTLKRGRKKGGYRGTREEV
jgi:hypothetical protein